MSIITRIACAFIGAFIGFFIGVVAAINLGDGLSLFPPDIPDVLIILTPMVLLGYLFQRFQWLADIFGSFMP